MKNVVTKIELCDKVGYKKRKRKTWYKFGSDNRLEIGHESGLYLLREEGANFVANLAAIFVKKRLTNWVICRCEIGNKVRLFSFCN